MSWKNWPSWKKGGVIGLIIGIFTFQMPFFSSPFGAIISYFSSHLDLGLILLTLVVITPLNLFLIGILIGMIFNKIKNTGWPYWLKGGTLGLFIGIILLIMEYIYEGIIMPDHISFILIILSYPLSIIAPYMFPPAENLRPYEIMNYMEPIRLYFVPFNLLLIGVIIGHIYRKIKK